MKMLVLWASCLLSVVATAQQPANEPFPAPAPPAAIPAAGNAPPFQIVNGGWDMPQMYYLAERDLKWSRAAGHAIALSILATCPGLQGKPDEKLQALYDMHLALAKDGPAVYRGGDQPAKGADGRWVTLKIPAPDIATNATMSNIAAVLTCRIGDRKYADMVTMLNTAFNAALTAEEKHPDTKRPMWWAPDLRTLLMVATLII